MKLDEKGRCCGRKPIEYRGKHPHKFCDRCDRAFDSVTGEQQPNWGWELVGDEFVRRNKTWISAPARR